MFEIENILWKSNFDTFWQLAISMLILRQKYFWFCNPCLKTLIFASYWGSPLVQFSKFKNFLWVCWFWGKNLSNFVYPVWKLHNPYCHNIHCVCKLICEKENGKLLRRNDDDDAAQNGRRGLHKIGSHFIWITKNQQKI